MKDGLILSFNRKEGKLTIKNTISSLVGHQLRPEKEGLVLDTDILPTHSCERARTENKGYDEMGFVDCL